MSELVFLGTGGGRFTTISQARQTGGMYLVDKGLRANIDPGPGALVHMHRYGLDPTRTNTVMITHAHPDHWTDATILIEGITRGGLDQKGTIIAPRSVLRGITLPDGDTIGPVLSPSHQKSVAECLEVKPGTELLLQGAYEMETTKQYHSDPDTIGIKIQLTNGQFSYIPDSEFHEDLVRQHKGSRMVVCQMTRGGNDRIPWHMCTEDVKRIADGIRPKLLMLTHFGYKMLKEGDPGQWAQEIMDETGIPTIAARDGMHISMSREFEIGLLGV